jgi:hypothetical protein
MFSLSLQPVPSQYLDNICSACAAGPRSLARFETTYKAIAKDLGVQLASTADPEKAFSPCTAGVVLGVHYDTISWTWKIPEEKLNRKLLQIR